jgi:putative membrane protein
MRNTIGLFLKGILIGLANIIPGVSGGTMALVLGIYDRMIRAIGRIGPRTVTSFIGAFRSKPRSAGLVGFAREHDVWFLTMLCVGAMAAIVATSKLMVYLLAEQHDPTYGFFWGLIAASVIVPYSMLDRRSLRELVFCVAAVAITVGIGQAMSPEKRLEAEQLKHAMKTEAGAAETASAPAETEANHSPMRLVVIGLTGAVAISAMVLPGVSGSFILLLLGMYFEILAAVNERDLVILAVFAVGCLVGLALFTRLLAYLLDRHRSVTMAFLVGLIIGSLWSIWPFKSFGMAGEKRIDLSNQWPGEFGTGEISTILAVVIGAAIVLGFLWWEKRRAPEKAS